MCDSKVVIHTVVNPKVSRDEIKTPFHADESVRLKKVVGNGEVKPKINKDETPKVVFYAAQCATQKSYFT